MDNLDDHDDLEHLAQAYEECGCALEPGHDGPCLDVYDIVNLDDLVNMLPLTPEEVEHAREVRVRTQKHYKLSPKEDLR